MGGRIQIQNYDNWIQDRAAFHNPEDMYRGEFSLVDDNGSIFPVSEDEAVKVEELYKCSDLGDDVLSLGASDQRMHYNFGEFLAIEYHPTKPDVDVPDSNRNLSDDVKSFCDGMLGVTDAIFPRGKSNLSDSYEDYILDECSKDSKFVNEATVPNSAPSVGAMCLASNSMVSDGKENGVEVSEVAVADVEVLDTITLDELHQSFRSMFGRETKVTDKQWLKNRLCFGSQNLFHSNDSQSETIMSTSNQCSKLGTNSYEDGFNIKRKSRTQHLKRKRCGKKSEPEFLDVEEDIMPLTRKRSRKPTQRYIEESMVQKSRHQKKYGASSSCSTTRKRSCNKRVKAKHFICLKDPFKGACIQVPFGEPVLSKPTKEKVHQSKNRKNSSRFTSPDVETDMDSVSINSQEDTSEDDSVPGTKKNSTRRKHHMYWSISEVLKLVEGVSIYGVGKWTEIKKLMFQSSANRTSVDLKDKWRNLLRASCSYSQRKREVEQRKKHPSQQIPQSILNRVRELAAIHPYPRGRKSQVPLTSSCMTPPIPNSSHDNCLAMSTAVRV